MDCKLKTRWKSRFLFQRIESQAEVHGVGANGKKGRGGKENENSESGLPILCLTLGEH